MARVVVYGTVIALAVGLFLGGCGHSEASSPFVEPGPLDAGPDSSPAALADAGSERAPDAAGVDAGPSGTWGGPCLDDGECNDGISCTHDFCDTAKQRCRFTTDAALCDDNVYCNGVEQCLPGVGCRPGEPETCSDGTACTIDACVEATHACVHAPRDADGDGDPDGNCPGGGDCNDTDPKVSSKAKEICGNGLDDNCNGEIDESPCTAPLYDVCSDPLVVKAAGTYSLPTIAAKLDYSASCIETNPRSSDLVVAVVVPDAGPVDVDLAATGAGNVALSAVTLCGDASSEIGCSDLRASSSVARLRLRSLAPGTYAAYVFTDSTNPISLSVDYLTPEPAPSNETCGTALPMTPGVHVVADLTSASADLTTACGAIFGDLLYSFSLAAPSDVHLFAVANDSYGTPVLSLRDASCDTTSSEIGCHEAANVELYRRALPAGVYYVDVASTGPSVVDVVLETAPPTSPPSDETCVGAPALLPNTTRVVDLSGHVDDLQLGCSVGTPDAAYALALALPSDVLLIQTVSSSDEGWVSLAEPACTPGASLLSCASSDSSLARAAARGVAPGNYRVIDESDRGEPTTLTAFVRPASSTFLVPFSDSCADATDIPSTGGLFQGNTANAANDFTASCDVGGVKGSPDQMLHLHLAQARRVVFSAEGSAYPAIVDVRTGATCPGTEVTGGCSAGYARDGAYLDLTLPAGDYWIQIDGYQNTSGAWTLDAYVVDQ